MNSFAADPKVSPRPEYRPRFFFPVAPVVSLSIRQYVRGLGLRFTPRDPRGVRAGAATAAQRRGGVVTAICG